MGCSRPQREQGRLGRGAQAAHNASPAGPRPATGFTTLQREQATAVWRLRHLGQRPPTSEAVSSRWARPQRAQTGPGKVEPRARSSATSLPTTGGAPTSRAPGPLSSAPASTDRAFGLGAAASIAERTWVAPRRSPASATRWETRSLQACWRPGLTPCGPPGPGGDGSLAPLPECSPSGRGRPWARLGPVPPAPPG